LKKYEAEKDRKRANFTMIWISHWFHFSSHCRKGSTR
jgi:hypothetical protein